MALSIIMGVLLVITSTNITEMPYMEVLKIIVSTMFGFRHFVRQYWSCMLSCTLDELLIMYTNNYVSITSIICVIV